MATEIQLKRSYTSGQIPGAANVLVGEPVLNLVDRVLYTKDNSGNIIVISSGNASTIASLAFNAANVAAAYTVAGVSGNVSNIQLASGITSSGLLTTANISELSNLYFTNARARESITIASSNVSGKGSYDSATGVISINAANVTVSSSAPTNPYVGDLWIHADTAVEYLFFGDGDTFQWVELGEPSTVTSGSTVGYLEAPQNAQNTSYTLTLTDSGKHIYSQNTATQVLTIPTNANVAFNVGTMVSIVLQGSGSMTVSPFSGVTLYLAGNSTSASRTISTYGMATLMKVATNTWFINGTGVS